MNEKKSGENDEEKATRDVAIGEHQPQPSSGRRAVGRQSSPRSSAAGEWEQPTAAHQSPFIAQLIAQCPPSTARRLPPTANRQPPADLALTLLPGSQQMGHAGGPMRLRRLDTLVCLGLGQGQAVSMTPVPGPHFS